MRICNLASGSSGNCTYIEGETTRVIIDDGKPLDYVLNALNELGVAPDSINAILITHEHVDHIRGIAKLATAFNIPIYAHIYIKEILIKQLKVKEELLNFFDSDFYIGDLHVVPFPVPHDSRYCVGYRINEEDAVVSIVTDIGNFTDTVYEAIKSSALIYLESNYDPEMLMAYPKYPAFLKKRIAGNNGHLSNISCAKAIEKLVHSGTRMVVLAHISEHSNSVNLAVNTIASYLESKNIIPNVNIRLDITYHEKRGTIFRLTPTSKKIG